MRTTKNTYFKAAKKLANARDDEGCCYYICFLQTPSRGKFTGTFEYWFRPARAKFGYWYGDFTEVNKLARSLGLLFMHEIDKENR